MTDRKKEEFMSQIEHYRAVLDDLQKQRALYQLKVQEIEKAISSLHGLIPEDAKEELPAPNMSSAPRVRAGKYAGMSVRWAILNLLSEDATAPMATGEIAEALTQGGIISNANSFSANVSAVLSNMNNVRGEVQWNAERSGWVISSTGKQVWAHIRARAEQQQQQLVSSSVQ